MPQALQNHKSCCVYSDHHQVEHLYIAGNRDIFQRLNISENEWEILPKLPNQFESIDCLTTIGNDLFLIGDGKSMRINLDEVKTGKWSKLETSTIPTGFSTTVGDMVYIYQKENSALYMYNPSTGEVISEDDGSADLKDCCAIAGISGNIIYFIGNHKTSYGKHKYAPIIEYDLLKKRSTVCGHLTVTLADTTLLTTFL